MRKTYIFGHRKPDTDSVTAAIALSYLKNKIGENTEPRVLGDINNETKFVLDHFHVRAPRYLNDVKTQIKDVNYRHGCYIEKNQSIINAFDLMTSHGISTIPVVDETGTFDGALAMKDIAREYIQGNFEQMRTSYQHIIDAIEGTEVLKFDEEIEGTVSVASFRSTTFIQNIPIDRTTVLILGDRHSIIEYAIENKAKLIIMTGDTCIKDIHLELARKNKVNIIRTSHNSFDTAKHVGLANYIDTMHYPKEFICFDEERDLNDLVEVSNNKKYSYYPIINKKNKCLGLVKLADLSDKKPKQVILVDHNEFQQSVDGIEESIIMEVVDHHKIGNIGTSIPINFRNMPVGSTNTIIYLMYRESGVTIPENIAGLMLSGLISDTLLLKSPTTTDLDREVLNDLQAIAKVDAQEYGMEMFKAGSSLKGKTKEEILYTDFKNFEINYHKIGVGQIYTMNIEEFLHEKEAYIDLINKVAEQNEYTMVALFVTDIIKNGSYVFYNESQQDTMKNAFDLPNLDQATYLDNVVSRKKQMIPNIMRAIDPK